ncbi:S8 family serine peptidase [Streptomyces sp. LN549]|uniref:S8 family peptidase n=1 Tax=Streptomyces sp. LN549 TaxID=3112979 RepID=UPI0037136A48
MLMPPLASSAEPAAGARPAAAPSTVKTVTLVTGDVVEVSTGTDGKQSVALLPRPDGSTPQAAISRTNDHVNVVPTEAFGLLQANRLDPDLFDVTTLIESGYDDASRATLPVIVDYGKGRAAATKSRQASVKGATRTLTVPELGVAAFHLKKKDALTFWGDLTAGSGAMGAPTSLAHGAARVDLDGKVEVALEHSVPQIHAPQAWAAGFDGKGATVAVLDTGYDATHPDLAGRVGATANFTEESSVKDGQGHGTHVASTVAGTGAASNGLRKGVAPKATLLIGKVLNNKGSGSDSMVLAGMVWAVDQGADVVSMSLGGPSPDDGTSPLAQAVNELSATSDTLFVVAAGNAGNMPSTVASPGSADAALTVGAVDVHDVMARFSSRGPRLNNGGFKPEVVAPGVDVTAARAAGTALGPVVDDVYTTISGTSMATPHVAGLAAMIKQQHPDWDGDQIKSLIANSTTPIADATGFDAGTGRVDALAAINQKLLAPASMSLGSFQWPHNDQAPTHTALTYTNTADTAVTLSLVLAGQDGSPEPAGASLADDQVTVPADGKASVDVILDPAVASVGALSAVVTATPDNGGGTVRTGVSYQIEREAYDVKVTIKPRTGTQSASHAMFLSSLKAPWVFKDHYFDALPGEQSATFRLPPGTYGTYATSAGLAADGAKEGVISYEPSFTVSKDTEIVLDGNDTGRFDYDVKRPVVTDGAALLVGWQGTSGATGEYAYYGAPDRLYARPSAGLDGTANISANWWLSQPAGVLTTAHGEPVSLQALPSADGAIAPTPRPEINARFKVVDAGRASAPDTSSKVKGAVAFVSGTCANLTQAATALDQAGAAAMVAYPSPGQACAGTIDGTLGLPTLQARAIDVDDVLAVRNSGRAALVTHKSPEYMYDLLRYWKDEVPDGGSVDGSARSTSALVERLDGLGSSSKDGMLAAERLIGWVPGRGLALYGLSRAVPFPTTVTHHVSTGANWERSVGVYDAGSGSELAFLWAPRTAYAARTTYRDTWFGGPISTGVSPLWKVDNGTPPPVREGGMIYVKTGAYVDAAGHTGHTSGSSPSPTAFSGRIYVDGVLTHTSAISWFMADKLPPGTHRLDVVTETRHDDRFWHRSTAIKTKWGFDSEQPTGAYAVLPMLNISYKLPGLSSTTTAPAGEYEFGVEFYMPDTVETRPVVERGVEISWDGGQTWGPAKLTKCGDTSCKVHVINKPGGQASLRVSATDAAGRTVTQEIINAYAARQ